MKAEQSRRLFARNYEIAVRDFVDGKPMRAIPLALPASVPGERNEKTGLDALKAMREAMKGGGE